MSGSAAERPRFQSVKKACHCEPVLTLAWQSVSKAPDFCVFSLISCKGITDSHVASRREASALGVLLGMTGVGFIDALPPSDRIVFLFLQRPEKLRLQVAPPLQRRGDLPQQGVPVAVEGTLQRQVVAGVVGAEHRALAVHML